MFIEKGNLKLNCIGLVNDLINHNITIITGFSGLVYKEHCPFKCIRMQVKDEEKIGQID